MSFADSITYVCAIFVFLSFYKKWDDFKCFIDCGTPARHLARIIVSVFAIHLIIWSFLNFPFYLNWYILTHSPFNYRPIPAFHTALALTNEYTSMGFYLQWIYGQIMKGIKYDMLDQLVDAVHKMLDQMGGVSDNQSALATLKDALHLLF